MNINSLIWDEWNRDHIARHKVKPHEVEEVITKEPIFLEGKKGRLIVIGPTPKGRMLTVILDPEPKSGVFYPVTARPASRKDRRIYKQEKGVKI